MGKDFLFWYRMLKVFTVSLIFAMVFFSFQVQSKESGIKKGFNIHHAKLENGLEVYVVPNHLKPRQGR